MEETPHPDELNNLIGIRPLPWVQLVDHLSQNKTDIRRPNVLSIIRRRLECDGAPSEIQGRLIRLFPVELAFSLFLCALRFHAHINDVLIEICDAIDRDPAPQMTYCVEKFHGDRNRANTADTVIGEAMTLLFSFFDDFIATRRSGNLEAIQYIRHRYPKSITYIDAHDFTPLHGVCCALNVDIFRYFIEWHLEERPHSRAGLYIMNDSGITSFDTLIDTQDVIVEVLSWLRNRGLLKSTDISEWLLIHRASHSSSFSTLEFLLDLFPAGVLSEDDDGNLPIHLHTGLRYRAGGKFSEQDFDIVELLIGRGITNTGAKTIGGLFHQDPDDEDSCTLESLLREVGETDEDRLWSIITHCLAEVGDYTKAPMTHAAIRYKDRLTTDTFQKVLEMYHAHDRDENAMLPLWHAVRLGKKWDDCVQHIYEINREALQEEDRRTGLPMLAVAASSSDADLGTIFELMRLHPNICFLL